MSRTLYETRALSGYAIQQIASDIELQKINGRGVVELENAKGIYLITENAEGVPPFNTPIEVNEEYYIDARSFTTVGRDGILKIRDQITHDFQVELAILERHWAHSNDKDEFFYLSSSNLTQFSNWLAGNVAHHYRMDYVDEMKVRGAAALFYIGQHFNNIDQDATKLQLVRYILKNVMVNQETIDFVQEGQEIDFPRTIDEFCKFLATANIHLQLSKEITPMVLGNIMTKTFTFGIINANLIMRTAFEHPPVWMSMRAAILNNTFLRKNILGEQLYKDRDHKQYLTAYTRFVDRYKDK